MQQSFFRSWSTNFQHIMERKFHYSLCKSSIILLYQSHINPAYTPHCNIIPLYISLIFQVVSMWKVPHYNPICSSLLHHPWHMPHPSHLPCFDQSSIMCWSIKFIQLLNGPFSVTSCYFLHLRYTYLPQQSIFELPCPMFYTQCDSPSFTSTCNNSKNYSSVYFSHYVLRQQI